MEPKLSCFTPVPTIFLFFFSFVEGADTLFVHWQCTQHRPSQWYDPYLWRLHLYAGTTKYPSTPFSIGWFQKSICWEISTLTLSNQLVLTCTSISLFLSSWTCMTFPSFFPSLLWSYVVRVLCWWRSATTAANVSTNLLTTLNFLCWMVAREQ